MVRTVRTETTGFANPAALEMLAEAAQRANRRDEARKKVAAALETAEDPKVKAKLQQVLEGL